MRREGNEIVFDDDEQHRRVVKAISFVEKTEKMIAAAMKAALSIEYEGRTWWDKAKSLCGEANMTNTASKSSILPSRLRGNI